MRELPPLDDKEDLKIWLARRNAYPKILPEEEGKDFTIYSLEINKSARQAIIKSLDIENEEECKRVREKIKDLDAWHN